ncbi:MAG: mechanosensitive ion channel, partial [Chlamydiia bacterium]|nr:mechanosensitive ion channel [Chlamydiia bacterium]
YSGSFWRAFSRKNTLSFQTPHPPSKTFFQEEGLVIFVQLLLTAAVFGLILSVKSALVKLPHMRAFARRPLSSALLISIPLLSYFYTIRDPVWIQFLEVIGWIALARVASVYAARPAEKVLLYGVTALQIFLSVFAKQLPQETLRITLLLLTLAGMGVALYLLKPSPERRNGKIYLIGIGALALLFGLAALAFFFGYSPLGIKKLLAALQTFGLAILALLVVTLATGAVEYAVFDSSLRSNSLFRLHGHQIAKGFRNIIFVLAALFVFSFMLFLWGFYATPREAVNAFFGYQFHFGERALSMGVLLAAAAIFYFTLIGSRLVQTALTDHVYPKSKIPAAAGISINRLVNYGLLFFGTLFALSLLGFSLTNITILGGALGVGIGFGLQEFVKNFVSGIILLFERPIKVGDVVDIGSLPCKVKKIGLRATVVMNRDNAEIIVPNWDMITKQVTNWSHRETKVKVRIPLGVAYSSDLEKVIRITLDIAKNCPLILKEPEPIVYFMEMGESSINFHLIAWTKNYEDRTAARTLLIPQIIERYREEEINIPFPTREVLMKTVI